MQKSSASYPPVINNLYTERAYNFLPFFVARPTNKIVTMTTLTVIIILTLNTKHIFYRFTRTRCVTSMQQQTRLWVKFSPGWYYNNDMCLRVGTPSSRYFLVSLLKTLVVPVHGRTPTRVIIIRPRRVWRLDWGRNPVVAVMKRKRAWRRPLNASRSSRIRSRFVLSRVEFWDWLTTDHSDCQWHKQQINRINFRQRTNTMRDVTVYASRGPDSCSVLVKISIRYQWRICGGGGIWELKRHTSPSVPIFFFFNYYSVGCSGNLY